MKLGTRTGYPTSEKEIKDAIGGGFLRETHHFDVKREIGSKDCDPRTLRGVPRPDAVPWINKYRFNPNEGTPHREPC
jgi:hypothetical protein